MSDTPDPKEAITDELSDQVDVGSLVKGESVGDQVDGESLGRSFGESVGALAGRKLGSLAAGRLRSKLPFRSGDDESQSLLGRLASAFVVALGKTLRKPQFRDPIESSLREYAEKREATETLDDAKETTEEVVESLGEDEDEGEESDEKESDEKESDEGGTDAADVDLNPDDVQAIREETYRELLETMDYSELQSVAKEVDVKANLGRDEMVDAIVEQFNDGEEDEAADAEDGEEGDGTDENDTGDEE
ncbi:hypothetical protein A4G99_00650 [Haladaptatus sp. R4]|uniref:hypothetical protein n=1 Tax=Haladaptatus sp. R4 TaxID=1679489 RepID=UPI0007B48164|nr:hypothetical protein [Haladaptatus sp. R4]KZN25081.1 hypothetical protein A4G99_00650 [Haladaptatus sp. R4]